MGRTFESVRLGAKEVSARWARAARALQKEDQIFGRQLAYMAKKHSSEAFYALDDPLEAAVFSALVEILKRNEDRGEDADTDKSEHETKISGKNTNGVTEVL